MSIKDKLASAVPTKSGKGCSMCSILEQLNDQDKEAIINTLSIPINDPQRITDKQIAEILKSEGYDISFNSVFRHRQNHLDKP
jgi:type II secretory ATPase GspE/PulE/Tfp pilus assembly ATPase PilB-like protein